MAILVRNLSSIFMCGVVYILFKIMLINSNSSKRQRIDPEDTVSTMVHRKAHNHHISRKTSTVGQRYPPMISGPRLWSSSCSPQPLPDHRITSNARNNHMKYILLGFGWYATAVLKLVKIDKEGKDIFIENKCKHINCYFTYNSKHLKDPSDFDAIVFSGLTLKNIHQREPYKSRSLKQKYVYGMTEPNSLFPAINPLFDDFFNWTWTYRLDSDVTWRYIKIYDLKGNVVGPAVDMKWPRNLKPINEELKVKLNRKTKAVAWFVSHCTTQSRREHFVEEFKMEFQKYDFSVDVFGFCGQLTCNKSMLSCFKMLEKDYHFYFSFENTLDVDYVTEKLLNALNNLVVPVVYGGANYSRFLPPGSYLNARELGPKNLAIVISNAIGNSTAYYEFFKWRNHFKYKSSVTTSELCNICTALNDEKMMKTSVVTNFRRWWNSSTSQRTYEFLLKTFLFDKNLQNLAKKFYSSGASSFDIWKYIKNLSNIHRESNISEFNIPYLI